MYLYQAFIRNNVATLLGHLLISAQGIIIMPLIIKTVGVTIYGGYVLLTVLLGFVFGISSLGVGFRSCRYLPSTRDAAGRRQLYYPQFCFQLASLTLLALLLIVFSPLLVKYFLKNEVAFSVWLILPYLLFYFLYSQTTDYFRYTHRLNYFNYATIAYAYLMVALMVLTYTVFHRLSVNVLLSLRLFSSLLVALALGARMIREIGVKPSLPTLGRIVDDIRLGLPLIISYVVDLIISSSDRYLIAAFISVTAVGYYNPGYMLGSLIVFYPKVSGVVLPPLLAQAVDSGRQEEANTMVNYAVKGFLLLAIPFLVGAAVLSKPLLTMFTNAEVAGQSFLVTPVVAAAMLFFGLTLLIANVLFIRLQTATLFKVNALGAVLNLSLNLALLYAFRNILVAACTSLLSYLVVFLILSRVTGKFWPILYDWLAVGKYLLAALIMGAALYFTCSQWKDQVCRVSYLLPQVFFGIAVYATCLVGLKTFSRQEWLYFKKAFLRCPTAAPPSLGTS